jgi:molybdopterin synthase catalytic subunit/molybdopterin converting factor small subunit
MGVSIRAMKVRILAFASAGDALGATELEMELPDGSRVADLRARLDRDHPALGPLWPRLAVAVDGRIAGRDALLSDGVEVALLPPVSGGSGRTGLVDGPIDLDAAVRSVEDPGFGAVVTFLGTVRNHHAGRAVRKLTYTAYRRMAADVLARIASELEAAAPVRVAIVHRLGEVPVGEPSVVIAVGSAHRAAAYEASRAALERLKAEVPIWKREHYAEGEAVWREEEPLRGERPVLPLAQQP